uniref:Guanine nucleotide-binding protein-like 1 n=1 Tax=Astyanax mexicanus TaxID=7994 RepID=W5L9P5_ASTMX
MPRRKPFSNKQKKKQLQVKRERKRDPGSGQSSRNASVERGVRRDRQSDTSDSETTDIRRINQQPGTRDGRYDPNFRLHFEKESKDEVERRKRMAQERILQPVPERELEMDINQIYPEEQLDFPRRPSWHYGMQREELLRKEERSFREFLENLHSRNPPETLSHFEHNLETWRQLWRVLEMSDVILLIVDIRHPVQVLQFPPALYHYITGPLKKQVVLVLNKIDLCPASLVLAWKHYITEHFPHLHCVCFTSHPGQPYSTLQKKRMRRKCGWSQAGGPIHIMRACQEITAGKDLSSWESKIQKDAVAMGTGADWPDDGAESVLMEHHSDTALEMSSFSQELYKDGVLTLGCIFPNVGKSSVLNSLVGRKVVSVSRTPGHTKYFQTYYLTPTVKLCDCPGLVFPSRVNKQLQIVAGIYPVSQLQEPYSSVGFLCERTPFLSVLKLTHPEHSPGSQEPHDWTAWDVCEWAERRGYKTAKAARNDVYRAANSLLRLAIDGRFCMSLRPPGYTQNKQWESHPELPDIVALQGRKTRGGEQRGEQLGAGGRGRPRRRRRRGRRRRRRRREREIRQKEQRRIHSQHVRGSGGERVRV